MGAEIAGGEATAAKTETSTQTSGADPSKSVWAVWIPIVVSISTLIGGGIGWGYSQYLTRSATIEAQQKAERDENNRLLNSFLVPIQLKLKQTQSFQEQLRDNFSMQGFGILESYVLNAKMHGAASQPLAYGLITDLAQTDAEIDALLEGYDPFHLTADFKLESDRFLKHAQTYVIRFKALPGLIASNEPFPSWMPFPEGFPSALEQEIMARKGKITNVASPASYSRKFQVTRRSSASPGGINEEQWCAQALSGLQKEYPGAEITKISSRSFSVSKSAIGIHREYIYECNFEVKAH